MRQFSWILWLVSLTSAIKKDDTLIHKHLYHTFSSITNTFTVDLISTLLSNQEMMYSNALIENPLFLWRTSLISHNPLTMKRKELLYISKRMPLQHAPSFKIDQHISSKNCVKFGRSSENKRLWTLRITFVSRGSAQTIQCFRFFGHYCLNFDLKFLNMAH